MANIEHRAVIKFLTKEGRTPSEIHDCLQNVYRDAFPPYSTVKQWAKLFKHGRECLEDDPRCGSLVTTITEESRSAVRQKNEVKRN